MVRCVRRNAPNEIGSLDAVDGGNGTAPEMLTSSGEPSSAVEPEIEFRSPVDDAWYNARPFLDGEKLTVRLVDFTDDQNEVYEAGKFTSVEVLNDLESRFRSISVQLQDSECSKVVEGIRVCASYSTDHDLRFYDAVVENVGTFVRPSILLSVLCLLLWYFDWRRFFFLMLGRLKFVT